MLQPSVCELLWSLFLLVVVKVVNSHFNLNSKLKFWLHIGDIPIQIVGSQSLWRGGERKAARHELSRDQGRDWWGIVRLTLSVRHVCSVGYPPFRVQVQHWNSLILVYLNKKGIHSIILYMICFWLLYLKS